MFNQSRKPVLFAAALQPVLELVVVDSKDLENGHIEQCR